MGHRDPKLDCRKTLMRIGVVNGVGVQNGVWRRCYLQTAFISRENNGLILLDIDEWRLWREMEILGAKSENWSKIGSEIWQVGQLWPTSGVLWRKVSGVHNDAKVLIYDIKVMILTTVAMMESFATR
jgi:hypothetical protein